MPKHRGHRAKHKRGNDETGRFPITNTFILGLKKRAEKGDEEAIRELRDTAGRHNHTGSPQAVQALKDLGLSEEESPG